MIATQESFSGFSPKAFLFLKELSANNNREWFETNKSRFKEYIQEPSEVFCEHLSHTLSELTGKNYSGKAFRIYRDVRFSKDKTPYNPYLRFLFSRESAPGCYYLSIETDKVVFGAGAMAFEPSVLESYRKFLSRASGVQQLAQLLGSLNESGPITMGEPELKAMPRGYSNAHESDFMKRKGLALWRETPVFKELQSPEAPSVIGHALHKMSPINTWIDRLK